MNIDAGSLPFDLTNEEVRAEFAGFKQVESMNALPRSDDSGGGYRGGGTRY